MHSNIHKTTENTRWVVLETTIKQNIEKCPNVLYECDIDIMECKFSGSNNVHGFKLVI